MKASLFLFPHQDDEFFAALSLRQCLEEGRRPICAFLTDGETARATAARRDTESRGFLRRLGITQDSIFIIESGQGRAPDGKLVEHLFPAFEQITQRIAPDEVDRIYSPAWEGGHQDHDAAHLLSLALARHWGVLEQTWQFYLYNGFNTRGKFFRVMTPLQRDDRTRSRRISLREGVSWTASCRIYRSQVKTWLGLLPQVALRLMGNREDVLQPSDLIRARQKPHVGQLLYERWGRMTYESFSASAEAFRKAYLE